MRITVNLATRPFVELRPIYQRLRIWMLALSLIGLCLWLLLHNEQKSAANAVARVQALNRNVDRLEREQQSYRALMQQPINAATLQDADFLNGLFKHKAFSWTATIEDLENVLPSGVQVVSLEPLVSPNGNVVIRLRVSGPRNLGVDLMRNLEKSRSFVSPRLASESLASLPGQGNAAQATDASSANALVNFDILSDYRFLPHTHQPHANGSKIEAVPFPPGMHVEGRQP
jgi:type IV pilus assembly protein PilN